MSDSHRLAKAVEAGIITADQARQISRLPTGDGADLAPVRSGDEPLKFLASLNDLFLTFGLIVLTGAAIIGVVSIVPMPEDFQSGLLLVALPVAGLAWLGAEYFCARRHMLLPSMWLALVFVVSIAVAAGLFFGAGEAESQASRASASLDDVFDGVGSVIRATGTWFPLGGMVAALVFFLRFRLPFAAGLAALFGVFTFFAAVHQFGSLGQVSGGLLVLITGLATLAAAIGFDMSDPERRSWRADTGFWLHLVAAPQIVLGVFQAVVPMIAPAGGSMVSLVVLGALAVLALALDRRALIVSSLVTFVLTIADIFSGLGLSGPSAVVLPLLVIGGAIVLLGAGWNTGRKLVLTFLPTRGVFGRIFPPEAVS